MTKVIGIRFRGTGKTYHFDPGNLTLTKDDAVIVETNQGLAFGVVSEETRDVPEDQLAAPLRPVLRVANTDDLIRYDEFARKEEEAFLICREKIKEHKLGMNLFDVSCTFDGRKIIFYFTADGRIDFRALVKDLASIFHTRIELRQVGVRDEARMIGGLGVCGRELCCSSYLNDFVPVSIKMAKTQNLSMNPTKISGVCGRLMCCLKYEQEAYEDALQRLPRKGARVTYQGRQGQIHAVQLLQETVTIRFDQNGEAQYQTVSCSELASDTCPAACASPDQQAVQPQAASQPAPVREAGDKKTQDGAEAPKKKRRSGRRRSSRRKRKSNKPQSPDKGQA